MTVRLYEEASLSGNHQAQNNLGNLYSETDPVLAFCYYSEAAEGDLVVALLHQAHCLEKGFGVEKDEGKARLAYQRAARTGDVER